MVTVELVFGILIASLVAAVLAWAMLLVGVQIGCIDTAAAVARQAARGDQAAVAKARAAAPRGATVQLTGSTEEVHVTVRVVSHPLDFVPAVSLRADASAVKEPGVR